MLREDIREQIINALEQVDPYRVILFGSHAWGEPGEDSDIDLYVVTKEDYMPENWSEKMEIKLKVARALKNLKKKYDIDLIVHTREMSKLFFQSESMLAKEMRDRGIIIL